MSKSWIFLVFFLLGQNIYSADIEIVISGAPSVTEKFAAEELSGYLKLITGEECRFVNFPSRNSFSFVVGNAGESERKEMNLGIEDFFIRARNKSLVISGGGNRGTLYAVYDFLEKLGCRWYYPDSSDEIIPQLSREEVIRIAGGLNILERPDFCYRIYQYQTHDIGSPDSEEAREAFGNFAERIDWLCKNRINIFQFGLDGKNSYEHWPEYRKNMNELVKRDMIPGISGHSYFMMLPDSVFSKHHDWWPEREGKRQKAGQFCTRNEEVVSFYLKNIVGFLRENPEIKYFTVWPADTYGWCNCSLCGSDSSVADRYLELSKRIYSEIKKEFPDIIFNHFAYGSHLEAPRHEVPPSDMLVTVCTWGRDFAVPFTGMKAMNGWEGNYYKDDFRKEFDSWRKITDSSGSPLIFHEKYIRHLGFGFLPLPLKILEEDFRYFKKCGIDGFELPVGFMGVRTKALNFYAVAKLMWDSETSVSDLEEDYFLRFYSNAGMLMKAAYKSVTEAQPNMKYFTELQKLEKDISPLEKYRISDLDYSLRALHYFNSAKEYTDLALATAENENIRAGIEKFRISLDYITEEYRGLLELATASDHIMKASAAVDKDYSRMELKLALRNVENTREISKVRREFISTYAGKGLIWDINFKGAVCIFYDSDIVKFEELIKDMSNQFN